MNKSEPAFPIVYKHENSDGSIESQVWSGMTLRDYFAGQVLPEMQSLFNVSGKGGEYEIIAHSAYSMADAMLKEREQ